MEFDFSKVKKSYRDWHSKDAKYPILSLEFGKPLGDRPEPDLPKISFRSAYDLSFTPKDFIDRVDYDLSCREYYYDAFPRCGLHSFGPGVVAAFLGAVPHPADHTVWFEAEKFLPLKELHFEYDPNNIWLNRIKEIYREGSRRWNGNVLMAMTDLGGILDILASFRGTENLLIDCIEEPEEILRCVSELQTLWFRYFDEFNEILAPTAQGYSHWAGIYDEQPTYILQCDFSYMISPAMFEKYVLPELQSSARRLSHASYHLDGIGELGFLDSLIASKEIDLIQWVPGSGEPEERDWTDVIKRITFGGKKLYYSYCNTGNLSYFFDTMRAPADLFAGLYHRIGEKDDVLRRIDALLSKI